MLITYNLDYMSYFLFGLHKSAYVKCITHGHENSVWFARKMRKIVRIKRAVKRTINKLRMEFGVTECFKKILVVVRSLRWDAID